ncbi:unnamed protein product [Discula destructiva]
MHQLEDSLATLPDPPGWSLVTELLAPAATSRVNCAAISQPLCTALQIALVGLLFAAGIEFDAAVGHSSGEMAAVYVAGYITAQDALRIAYYRGLHTEAMTTPKPGRMMAVGMSFDEAQAFCQREEFQGRIVAAASNSRTSTTLSGDADAIAAAHGLLAAEGTFARALKVEKAYHSHHMEACAQAYLESLRKLDINVQVPDGPCALFSSVYGPDGRSIDDPSAFRDTYWVMNLMQPVLFSQALHRAVSETSFCFDAVLEVGPHAALKGPATETLKTLTGIDLPYAGVLARGQSDANAFSDALGMLWSRFSSASRLKVVDLRSFREACAGQYSQSTPCVVKGLPSYSWDHQRPLWRESRFSRVYGQRKYSSHELLGSITPSSANNKEIMIWRNVMKLSEMQWLRGHQFQGQVLFPAAGYVSMAVEAAVRLHDVPEGADALQVELVELEGLQIHKAITLEDDSGTNVIFVIRVLERTESTITAEYTCHSAPAIVDAAGTDHALAADAFNFTGRATVTLGTSKAVDILPQRVAPELPLVELDLSRFYTALEGIGLKYADDFLMLSASRRLNMATVQVTAVQDSSLYIHPATLDASFHGVFAGFSFPGDRRMLTTYLPTSIERVRVALARSPADSPPQDESLIADCHVRGASARTITGDVSLFSGRDDSPRVQIEGLICTSFAGDNPRFDRATFASTIWKPDISSGAEMSVIAEFNMNREEMLLANEATERVAYFYLRALCGKISRDEIPKMEPHFQYFTLWVLDHTLPCIDSDLCPRVTPDWKSDTSEIVTALQEQYRGHIAMDLVGAIGKVLPAICRGELPVLQVMRENDMLNTLYREGLGAWLGNLKLAGLVGRFAHRYPHIKILEVGGGTGGTTKDVLDVLRQSQFESYTFTDISPGFFESARAQFREHVDSGKLSMKTLNIEQDPVPQGYVEHSYDLVIACNVLHATKTLSETLQNCRKLLKPGGYLVLLEVTSHDESILPGFLMGTLPGWWFGREDGRAQGPTITQGQWDVLLRENGFSGVDASCQDVEGAHYSSVMASQAVDDRVAILRRPLSVPAETAGMGETTARPSKIDLAIIGGKTAATQLLITQLEAHLGPFINSITTLDSLEPITEAGYAVVSLCLADLDEPVWQDMTEAKFNGMQKLMLGSSHLLWITKGRRADQPYHNMMIGIGRSVRSEVPDHPLQFLDIDSTTEPDAKSIAETLLRLVYISSPGFDDVLWSLEYEICMDDKGHMNIPRILPDEPLNQRMNAARRPLETLAIMPFDTSRCVELVYQMDSRVVLRDAEMPSPGSQGRLVHVHASSRFPFVTRDQLGHSYFLCAGTDVQSGARLLFLSPNNTSIAVALPDKTVDWGWGVSTGTETNMYQEIRNSANAFVRLLAYLVAESLTIDLEQQGMSLWLHEADETLAQSVRSSCMKRNIPVFLSTSVGGETSSESTFVHPRTPARELKWRHGLPPEQPIRFVTMDEDSKAFDFGHDDLRDIDIERMWQYRAGGKAVRLSFCMATLREVLSGACLHLGGSNPYSTSAILPGVAHMDVVLKETVPPVDGPANTVAWTTTEAAVSGTDTSTLASVSVLVRSLELGARGLFSNDKTYFLVGLTADVGMSICNWMIDHGARHLAVTSRNPQIHPSLVREFARKGANFRAFALDIADEDALGQFITPSPPPGFISSDLSFFE